MPKLDKATKQANEVIEIIFEHDMNRLQDKWMEQLSIVISCVIQKSHRSDHEYFILYFPLMAQAINKLYEQKTIQEQYTGFANCKKKSDFRKIEKDQRLYLKINGSYPRSSKASNKLEFGSSMKFESQTQRIIELRKYLNTQINQEIEASYVLVRFYHH